ncbi:glutathione S-transferase family protein [Pararhodobacter zhoushanensis]|uniref:FtsZ-binding protein FzlA n=1 Tax=Pararhodobacter zhoushanensis TaxID=2479545 RepID=UPI000F8D88AC|nr:glutathione S-transferase family protein [Pararhodobacter zhoushanensis]
MHSPVVHLHHVPLSPFCRKVRLTLAEKRIPFTTKEERYWEGGTEFLRLNAAGKVPIVRYDGRLLSESQAICEFIDEVHVDPPLMPDDPAGRYEVRRLCAWFDDKFHSEVTANLLYERVNKKITGQGYPDSQKIKTGSTRIKFHLDYMGWLLEHRRWLAGSALSLADFAAAAHLSCLDYISDVDWERAPAVKAWYATIKSRPAFRPLLTDQVPGFPPPRRYADLDF